MQTECYQESFGFQSLGRREVVGRFDGGAITSDGGGVLLRETDRRLQLLERFAGCFRDYRTPHLIEFTARELVTQRVLALALGYEDLNDHDELRLDPLLAVLAGREDPTGADRRREGDRGKALAGKSTLNRVELSTPERAAGDRYKRLAAGVWLCGSAAGKPVDAWFRTAASAASFTLGVPRDGAAALAECGSDLLFRNFVARRKDSERTASSR